MLLDKKNALYVKCCIIPNGITDSQGDTLYGEDIKKIFTSFNNQDNFEIYHNDLPIQEVSLLENYISTADERIGNLIIPPGSWNATVRVDNPEIKERLLTGEFGGVSLNNRIAPRCKGKLKGIVRYKDVPDAECVIPLLISFVEGGANGYPLHVMDYDAYIKKSKDIKFKEENGGHLMDFKEFLNGLKSLIKEAEEPPVDDAAIEKEDETMEEEKQVEETEEETSAEEEPVVEKEDTTTTEEEEEETTTEEENEPTVEKAEEETVEETLEETTDTTSLEERVAALEKIVAELTATEEEEVVEDKGEEMVDEDTPKITKSEKVVITDTNTPTQTNYYEMRGRDPLTGKKIRE